MSSYPQEFLVLCRQWGEAQRRCSAALTAQAAEIQALALPFTLLARREHAVSDPIRFDEEPGAQ